MLMCGQMAFCNIFPLEISRNHDKPPVLSSFSRRRDRGFARIYTQIILYYIYIYISSLLLFHPFCIEKKETDFGQDCHPSSYSKILQFSGASSKLRDNALWLRLAHFGLVCGKGHPWPLESNGRKSLKEELEESYTVHPCPKKLNKYSVSWSKTIRLICKRMRVCLLVAASEKLIGTV